MEEPNKLKLFPIEIFPPVVQQYIREVSQSMNCPPDYVAAAILISVAVIIGNSHVAVVKKGWIEKCILYLIAIGLTGKKKTPAMRKGMEILIEIQKKLKVNYESEKQQYDLNPQEYKAEATEQGKPVPPKLKQILTTDATIEALAQLLLENPNGILLFREEIIALIKALNQYKGGRGDELEKYLILYNGLQLIINRVSKPPIQIDNPFLCIFGGIQDDLLSRFSRIDENGFKDRFLFVFPDPIRLEHTDDEISDQALENYLKFMQSIHDCIKEQSASKKILKEVKFSKDAYGRWAVWHKEHIDEMNDPWIPYYLLGAWIKIEAYLIRFSLICEIMRGNGTATEISPESVESAIKLVDYFKSHARKTYDSMNSSSSDKSVIKAV
ncbi:MAG: DUF3987 domain-containing protein, partial [Bacteroidales bacterium]|nr:DUF3987 domain-containing protein [Bacteroidales bacterium]